MFLLVDPADLPMARPTEPAMLSLEAVETALDEAFATVAVPVQRHDTADAAREKVARTAQLAEALREQLVQLDSQRRHLTRLLDGLDA
jgi:hypothetical protein